MSIFTAANLLHRLSPWDIAALAVETYYHTAFDANTYAALQSSGWFHVTGFAMPPEVGAYLQVSHPRNAAKAMARLLDAKRAVSSKYVGREGLAQRLHSLAASVSPDHVSDHVSRSATRKPTLVETWQHVSPELDRPARAAVACLLYLLPADAQVPPVVGDLTAEPVCWDDVPTITQVLTDSPLPVVQRANQYAVLCHSASQNKTMLQKVSALAGHVQEVEVDGCTSRPLWLAHHSGKKQFVIGCAGAVVRQHGDTWDRHEPAVDVQLPLSNRMSKVGDYIVWQHKHAVRIMRVDALNVVEDDEDAVQRLQVKSRAVAARGTTVFSEGVILFQLPPSAQQAVAAVHAPSAEYVDVFTTVGDWWRVHVKTLTAHVVGLDLKGFVLVDACVY